MVDEYRRFVTDDVLDSLYRNQAQELLFTNFICGAVNTERNPANNKFRKDLHQYRLASTTIVAAREVLEKAGLDRLTSFREILERVIGLTRKAGESKGVRGFGVLACYDFTLRYARSRGIQPEVVYLHAGTAEGLGYLMASEAGKDITIHRDKKLGHYLDPATLPESVAALDTHHIENFLCVYHKRLKEFAKRNPRKS